MEQTKRRRGRPPVDRRRVPMTMRVTPRLHDEILARSEATGRSITQEAELLLEQAMTAEKTLGSKAWRAIIAVAINIVHAAETLSDAPDIDTALEEPAVFQVGLTDAIIALVRQWPGNPTIADIDRVLAIARERIEQNMERDQ
jgi:hypothetical protein